MAIQNVSGQRYNRSMTTTYKPYTISELIEAIYEDHYSHFDFIDEMNSGECYCQIHTTMNTIVKYWGE